MRASIAAVLLAACAAAPAAPTGPRVIRVEARKYSYSPSRIEVRAGEEVVLELVSTDRLHGFYAPDLGIQADVEPGRPARIPLRVDRPGTYVFHCDVFCGSGHDEMEGEIVAR